MKFGAIKKLIIPTRNSYFGGPNPVLQALARSFDFIIDSASGDHPFDPYMSLLKTAGIFVLVGFPSEVKLSPASLILGTPLISKT